MQRYLDEGNFERFIGDFQFLFELIGNSYGELDLRLRKNYFNVYYRGNSMFKVRFAKRGYQVIVHKKFAQGVFEDRRFTGLLRTIKDLSGYNVYQVEPDLLHPFLQRKNIDKLATNVKKVNYGEEIAFEQALITDNLNREDYLIIDRQVTERELKGKRIDLLGLRKNNNDAYSFELIEVKMGNSSELREDVGEQLLSYLNHIKSSITRWKGGYEKTYYQLKQTNIFERPAAAEIVISPEVSGRIVVIGYSGLAEKGIELLKNKYPDIAVQQNKFLL